MVAPTRPGPTVKPSIATEQTPHSLTYLGKTTFVALGGEWIARHFNLDKTLSLKTLTHLMPHFGPPGVDGANVAPTDDNEPTWQEKIVKTIEGERAALNAGTAETGGSDGSFKNFWPCFTDNKVYEKASEFWEENKDWVVFTGGFTTVFGTVNYLTANKIENAYARNALSLLVAGSATWAAANYGVGCPLEVEKVADTGLRMLGSLVTTKWVVGPAALWATKMTEGLLTLCQGDISYPTDVNTKK